MKSGMVFGICPCSFPWLLGPIASFVWRPLVGCHQPLDGRRGWWWGPDAVNGDATKPHSLFALTAGRCTSAQADAGRDRARAGEDWEMWKFSLVPKDKGKNRWLFCRSAFHFFLFPIGSMYGIYGNIYHQYTPNVSIYASTMDPMGFSMTKCHPLAQKTAAVSTRSSHLGHCPAATGRCSRGVQKGWKMVELAGPPCSQIWSTLWLFNIAMENFPFIDDFPINTSIYKGFSMAMLNNQMVNFEI